MCAKHLHSLNPSVQVEPLKSQFKDRKMEAQNILDDIDGKLQRHL